MMIGWIIGGVLAAALLIFIAVILIRTAMFKPVPTEKLTEDTIELDHDKIISDMQDMIRCKTVSNRDESLVNRAEFEKFHELLKERFPLIHEKCTLEKIGKTGLLYHLPGKSSKKPSVCMAHYDVVPIEEDGWTKPAFDGLIEDGFLWGRGTLDTKGTLCGVTEALEAMLAKGYIPENDLYLSFSGEEEIDGDSCADIV
ncbi:MAG: M20/M25/M40 family metallo-hydrolase, partial [Firmicutes bacterium]|nr:M20/M25/M40 family metallo-hydrolase [Bacillota bacterium]